MQFVFCIILIVVIVVAVNLNLAANRRSKEEQERIRKLEKEEKERIQKLKDEQDGYQTDLTNLCNNTITTFESLPTHLRSAEECLNMAEFEFSEGAFAPFWDAIEEAVNRLGYFDQGVNKIEENLSRYTKLIMKFERIPPKFPLANKSVDKISISTLTSERMKKIVRKAQQNFQFATIYEQRKTNKILIAGFGNLSRALNRMTYQITNSIDNLYNSVNSITSSLDESMDAIYDIVDDISEENIKHNSEVVKSDSARAVREEKALKMLDNIQSS